MEVERIGCDKVGRSRVERKIRVADQVRIVYGSRDDLAEVVRNWLTRERFETRTESVDRTMYVQGHRNAPLWNLVRSGVPPRVRIALAPTDTNLTRVSIWFEATHDFQVWLFGILVGGFLSSFILLRLAKLLVSANWAGPSVAVLLFAAGWLELALVCAFSYWLVGHGTYYQRMGKRLFEEIETQIGGHVEVVRILPISRESFAVVVTLLIGLASSVAPWWKSPEVQIGLGLVLVVLAWVWCLFRRARRKGAGIRWTPFLVPLICSGMVAVYATAPFWGMWFVRQIIETNGIKVLLIKTTAAVLMIFIILTALVYGQRGLVAELISEIDYMRAHPDLISDNSTRSRATDIPMFLLWLLFSAAHWFAIGEMIALLANYIVNPSADHRWLWLLLYWLPVASILSSVIARNLWRARFSKTLTSGVPQIVSNVVTAICAFANLQKPRLALNRSTMIEASVSVSFRPILTISQGALDRLTIEEIGALLAHEIGHLKRHHVFVLGMLRFLSRWTILGEGFLTALTPGSVVMEHQADAFAISWLKHRGQSRQVLIDLLKKIERENVLHSFSTGAGTAIHEFSDDWMPLDIRRSIKEYSTASFLNRLRTIQRSIYFFLFENWAAFYVYPPLYSRIKAIEQLKYG